MVVAELLLFFFIFSVGLIFGSFFGVLIDRLVLEESPVKGRSHCDYCKKTLGVFDLIPVISFVLLGGKCRYCKKKLSIAYPIVELVTGMVFVGLAYWMQLPALILLSEFGGGSELLRTLASILGVYTVASSFLIIVGADFKYQIIPDELLVTAILGTVLIFFGQSLGLSAILNNHLLSALGTFLFFLLLYAGTKGRGIGFGDVKLVFMLGLLSGFPGIIVSMYVAFLTGAGISLILIWAQKTRFGARVAFGPFLIFGTIIGTLFQTNIINWYLRLFL